MLPNSLSLVNPSVGDFIIRESQNIRDRTFVHGGLLRVFGYEIEVLFAVHVISIHQSD